MLQSIADRISKLEDARNVSYRGSSASSMYNVIERLDALIYGVDESANFGEIYFDTNATNEHSKITKPQYYILLEKRAQFMTIENITYEKEEKPGHIELIPFEETIKHKGKPATFQKPNDEEPHLYAFFPIWFRVDSLTKEVQDYSRDISLQLHKMKHILIHKYTDKNELHKHTMSYPINFQKGGNEVTADIIVKGNGDHVQTTYLKNDSVFEPHERSNVKSLIQYTRETKFRRRLPRSPPE